MYSHFGSSVELALTINLFFTTNVAGGVRGGDEDGGEADLADQSRLVQDPTRASRELSGATNLCAVRSDKSYG